MLVRLQSVSELSIRSVSLEDDELGPKKQNKPNNKWVHPGIICCHEKEAPLLDVTAAPGSK